MRQRHGPLTRDRDERLLGGVCAGLATHLDLPVAWVRWAMVLFALLGGAGAVFYLWLWVLVPSEHREDVPAMRSALTRPASQTGGRPVSHASPLQPGADPGDRLGAAGDAATDSRATTNRATRAVFERAIRLPIAEVLLGSGLIVAGVALVLNQTGVNLRLDLILPAMAVLVGLGLTWWQIADRERPERHMLPRVLGALALVAVGVLMFFVTAGQPSTLTIVGAAFAVLAGVALALAPLALRVNRELIAERAGRARESERAEIAAHLHDSVLQTLAAIQQRSEPGSEVARLARRQERELRDWLFRSADGAAPASTEAVDVELGQHAASLEAEHAVRFEVIGVGAGRAVPEAIVAAAKEAMLNAARHAGGEVTVYIEATPDRVAIDVTDRGDGLDLAALPEGRMGVRESIIGRMRRAGGEARIMAGPGGTGTSIRLSMPSDPRAGEPSAEPSAEKG